MKYEHKVLIIVGFALLLFGVAVVVIQEDTKAVTELKNQINASGCEAYLNNYLTRVYGPTDFRINTSFTKISNNP